MTPPPPAAIAAAREGNGPRLIEALTYRLGDHTTADDAARYRSPKRSRRAGRKSRSHDCAPILSAGWVGARPRRSRS